jgi:hypothetical protein
MKLKEKSLFALGSPAIWSASNLPIASLSSANGVLPFAKACHLVSDAVLPPTTVCFAGGMPKDRSRK